MTNAVKTEHELVEKARAFVPILRERAKETEEIRRIPEATMQELKMPAYSSC